MSTLVQTRFLLKINRIVLAVAAEVPPGFRSRLEAEHAQQFQNLGAVFEIWDATDIGRDLMEHFHQRPTTMSVDDIATVLTTVREGWPDLGRFSSGGSARVVTTQPALGGSAGFVPTPAAVGESARVATTPPVPQIVEGEYDNVVVLCCDFVSYSKFVHASGSDRDLIVSVMGRFYRETRAIVAMAGGILDKFMGDGILAFWRTDGASMEEVGARLSSCVYDLTGTALAIAESWQDEIDLAVDPTGMTFGAAIGTVLLISENHDSKPPIHAIGECINLAARLQAQARPNTMLVTNKLKKACFAADAAFKESESIEAKNIGKVMVWRKAYEIEDDATAKAADRSG
jgi:class 3 adenylate cyclase